MNRAGLFFMTESGAIFKGYPFRFIRKRGPECKRFVGHFRFKRKCPAAETRRFLKTVQKQKEEEAIGHLLPPERLSFKK